jgi:cytochrome c oxidase subunit IV
VGCGFYLPHLPHRPDLPNESAMSGHVSSLKVYLGIFLTLMVLTAVTIAVAYVDLGPFNKVVALGIASFKATLVVLYFMHVKYASRLTKLVVVAGFFFLAVLLGLTMSDYSSRAWVNPPALLE